MATTTNAEETSSNSFTQTILNAFETATTKTADDTMETRPWIKNAVQQAKIYQKNLEDAFNYTLAVTKSRISEIRETSHAHLGQTIESLRKFKSEFLEYENVAVEKIREGVYIAASNPAITCGAVAGLGVIALKRPRRFITSHTLRIFMSEESMLARVDSKVKELRKSVEYLKAESEKLEKKALQAEEDLKRGRTKLKQAGKQIQHGVSSAYKIERQARGLKDVLRELPSREASRFRSQVSALAYEAKRERNVLTKEVSRISNYGISI